MANVALLRGLPTPDGVIRRAALTPDNFGVTYVRWPYDPAVSGGEFTSQNASRWQSELDGTIGWIRAFDPNLGGRYSGGSFVQDGMTSEGSPVPYGRMVGGTWYKGMLKSDGTYDFSKLGLLGEACRQKRVKLLLCIGAQCAYYDTVNNRYTEYPLPTGEYFSTGPTAYWTRYISFMEAFLASANGYVHAIEMSNEPVYLIRKNTVVGSGYTEQLAIEVRIAKQIIQAQNYDIQVCSPPLQGGEYTQLTSLLTASAAGPKVYGVDGTGSTTKDWLDVVCHHNYGNFSDRGGGGSTTTMDAASYNSADADTAYPNNTTFTDCYAKGLGIREAARLGGWTGPIWNSEFNCTGNLEETLWHPRKLTSAGYSRIFYQLLVSSILGGYDKHIIYAADHPALGFYDNTGTVPAGEPATWYFKAPDNTPRGATALAAVLRGLTGLNASGVVSGNPAFSVDGGRFKRSTSSTGGVFTFTD